MSALTFAVSLGAVIFLTVQRKRKRGGSVWVWAVYCMIPVILAGIISAETVGTAGGLNGLINGLKNSVDRFYDVSEKGVDLSGIWAVVSVFLISLPGTSAAVIGMIPFITGKNGSTDKVLGFSLTAAVCSLIPAAGAVFFGCVIALYAFTAMTVGFIELAAFACFFTLITLGIGLIILSVGILVFILILGAGTAVNCAGFAAASFAWGCAFLILHAVSAAAAVSGVIRLCRDGRITNKNAVVYGIVSFIPAVNIITTSILKKSDNLRSI